MVTLYPNGTDLILVTLYQVTLIHLGFTCNW